MKQKATKSNFSKAVAEEIEKNPVRRGWFENLPQSIQEELNEVRNKYRAGDYPVGSLPVATAICKVLSKKNVRLSAHTVRKWLLGNSQKT